MKILNFMKEKIKLLIKPRFTTSEFEWGMIRKGYRFELLVFKFEEFERYFPYEVNGIIRTPEENIRVSWNQYGKCTIKGKNYPECDILRPHAIQKEIDSTRNIGLCFAGLIILLGILIIYL